jgi:predicted phage tail protein
MGIKVTRKRVVGAAAAGLLAIGATAAIATAAPPNPTWVSVGATPTLVALSSNGAVGTTAYSTAAIFALNVTAAPINVQCTLADTSTPPFGTGKPPAVVRNFTANPLQYTTAPVMTNFASSNAAYAMTVSCTAPTGGILIAPGANIIP